MIQENSFLELLEKEKEAVFQYNLSLDRISNELKFHNQRLIENQGDKEYLDFIIPLHTERMEEALSEKSKAEKDLNIARKNLKEYLNCL